MKTEETQEFKVSRSDIFGINPKQIYIDRANVREEGSYPAEKFSVLKASIKENGVLEPIHVRKTDKGYALVHGFNRMDAVWQLIEEGYEIVSVKCLVVPKATSQEEELLRHFILNSGEPLTKYEISKIFISLKNFGWSNKDIATKTGYSEQEVSNLITFQSQGSMELKNAVKEGVMNINPAISLIRETENTTEQNEVLEVAKEKAKSENRTKIKSTDVLVKKLTLQDKFAKCLEIASENENEKMQVVREFFALLSEKNATPEEIVAKFLGTTENTVEVEETETTHVTTVM